MDVACPLEVLHSHCLCTYPPMCQAMAMGAVPITSRHRDSVLPELIGDFDLGPPSRPGTIDADAEWQRLWADAVVAAATADVGAHR